MSHKRILIILGAFALFAAAAVAGYVWQAGGYEARHNVVSMPPPVPDDIAGAFAADFAAMRVAEESMTLPDIAFAGPGETAVRISDFQGKPLLVNLWATWCAPCVVELPSLKRFADHYEGRIQVIGIALEAGKTQKDVESFLNGRKLGDFAAHSDPDGAFASGLGLRGIPTSFLIGSDGHILYRFEGDADWSSAESKAFFDVFLSNQEPKR